MSFIAALGAKIYARTLSLKNKKNKEDTRHKHIATYLDSIIGVIYQLDKMLVCTLIWMKSLKY